VFSHRELSRSAKDGSRPSFPRIIPAAVHRRWSEENRARQDSDSRVFEQAVQFAEAGDALVKLQPDRELVVVANAVSDFPQQQ